MKFRNDPPRQIVLTSILSKTLTYRYRNVNEKKKKKGGTCVNLSFQSFLANTLSKFRKCTESGKRQKRACYWALLKG